MLKQLKYFQSVVRLGSFSAVAEENFISQSAISQQVQSLERELGFALLVRKNRSFSLTPAGEYFYRKSLLLTADCDRMCAEAAKIAKGEAANLKIGYLRTYAGGGESSTARSRPFRRGIPTAASPSRTAAMGSCVIC